MPVCKTAPYPSSNVVTPYTRFSETGPTGIHPRSLEHWRKSMRGRERHGHAVWLRHVEEHLTTRWAYQCRKHRFGRVHCFTLMI
jgi:hypothetical protein